MRAGGCTVQQALTPEAAAVVKQAVSLARRRGNAQVTPLHVASAMLHQPPPSSGLLRAACLRSHPHPLQCKALELCFNVALNRLPASAPPFLGHGHVYHPPCLSNALAAAFKRAQAHQRRGAVDTQQQPVLAVKIELEQLVISILDDPSVSRVMCEAGFSSTQVKADVEQAVSSIEAASNTTTANPNPSAVAPDQETKPSKLLPLDQVRDEDVAAVLDCLATRSKRRVVVVAECAAAAEAAARAAVDRIKRGDSALRVATLAVSAFRDLPSVEAERRLVELRRAVKAGGAVVLVVEDLGWAAEFWAARAEAGRGRWPSSCCAVEHVVVEVSALACRGGDGDGVWLVGHGTYQSYMRCRAGQPSLESLWGLQTVAVPAGSLALSLNCVDDSAMAVNHQSIMAKCDRSGSRSESRCLSLLDGGGSGQLTAVSNCCGDGCATKCAAMSSSSIPPWLQRCRDQEPSRGKKWSSVCGGSPSNRTTLNLSTVVSPSSSVSSYEHLHQHPYQPWLVADEAKHLWKAKCAGGQVHVIDDEDVKVVSAIKAKSHDSSASNGSVEVECRSRFKELTAENLKVLCSALEKEVPWQAEIVPEIASTVLRCRSGMARRRRTAASAKEGTWMLFLGGDADGKARVARGMASLVFGSRKSFVSISAAASSPARSDSTEHQHKRPRPAAASHDGCLERLYEALRDDPRRVIMVEDVDQADRRCQTGIADAVERGAVRSHGGDEAALGDAIVVLSCERLDARSRACSPPAAAKKARPETDDELKEGQKEAAATSPPSTSSCFDLNMSIENDDVEESSFTDAGLLNAVDRAFFFRRSDEASD
ncbi:hypothetical protein ACP70R_031911 [Stipagrostis hirtigluma subsp. patula]